MSGLHRQDGFWWGAVIPHRGLSQMEREKNSTPEACVPR